MKTKKSRQSWGLAKQLGTKKCSANPTPAKKRPFGRVLYSKAPSPKNTTGKVQTQTAVLDQRLPTKIPNKAAMVRLRNHSRASTPAIECARPIRDHADQIEDSTIAVPKIATTRFNTNAPRSRRSETTREFFFGVLRSVAGGFTVMFRRRSSSARTASSIRASASVASAIRSSSLLDE